VSKVKSLYDQLGKDVIEAAVRKFYEVAFDDPIIGHFFFHKSHEELIAKQFSFTCTLLGGPESYQGKSMTEAHTPFAIRHPHFMRRQEILKKTLQDMNLDPQIIDAWLAAEDKLKPLIITRTMGLPPL